MKSHREQIKKDLRPLDNQRQALFALLCADRLHACCWANEQVNKGAFTKFASTIEDAFKAVSGIDRPKPLVINSWICDLESCMPKGGEPLQVQGQSAVLCLHAALNLLLGADIQLVETAINAVMDSIDNYVFFVRRRILNDLSSPETFPLLDRELERQLSDVNFVARLLELDLAQISCRRIDNFQYAVPIAV